MTYEDIDDWITEEFDIEDYDSFEDFKSDIKEKFNEVGRNPIDKIYGDRQWQELEIKFNAQKDIQEEREIKELEKKEFAQEEEERQFAEEEEREIIEREEKDLIFKDQQKQILKELYDSIDQSFIDTDPKDYTVEELETIDEIIETKPKTLSIKSTIIKTINRVTSFFGKLFR